MQAKLAHAAAMLGILLGGCAAGEAAGGDPGTNATPPSTTPTAQGGITPTPAQAPGATAPATTAATTPVTGTIVPLYTPPTDGSWNVVAAAKLAHPRVPVVAAVNPASGPGPSPDPGYTDGIAMLQAAGVKVIGYVHTSYGARPTPEVMGEIDRWKVFYPQIQGIFFDEQANQPGQEQYYRDLSQHAKAQGFAFTVGNPGSDSGESYVGALDTSLIYENSGVPPIDLLGGWHDNHPREGFGVIPYATGLDHAFVKAAKAHVGWIYLNSDNLPNPWDTVPNYFSNLLSDLE